MKKIIMIVVVVLLVLGIIVGGVLYFSVKDMMKSQVTLQYDEEMISEYKRELSFEGFELDNFQSYETIEKLVTGATIDSIQKMLLKKDFTMVELTQYYLTNVDRNKRFNSVIQLNPKVLEQAKIMDEKISKGQVGELFGVVVLIKDNIASVDMNTAAGAYPLKDLTTSRNASMVESMTSKDALILGKANLSEWSNFMSMPSSSGFSVLGGQTKNPYGKFDVGGSSSGSSVAASLNLATVTIGSETAGSLIFPAGQNSVVALKPTMGLISRDLIIPISEAQDTAGVIARNVKDLDLVFRQVVEFDANDQATSVALEYDHIVDLNKDSLKNKKLAVVDNGSEEMKKIIEDFRASGAIVEPVTLADDQMTVDMMSVLNYGIIHDVKEFLNNESVQSEFKSMEAIIDFYESNSQFAPYGNQLHVNATEFDGDVEKIIASNKKQTRAALDLVLKDYDAIISMSNELSGIYAPAGYPALTVPSGYRDSGEPYGVTLVGGHLQDNLLIELAYAYEQNTKYRIDPVTE